MVSGKNMKKNRLQITEYKLKSPKVKRSLSYVMLADLHNQRYGAKNEILLDTVGSLKPDGIFLAGDMVVCHKHAKTENLETAHTLLALAEIAPVFYGIGNHEAGIRSGAHHTEGTWQQYLDILRENNDIHMLSNCNYLLADCNVCVHGLDIQASHYKRLVKTPLSKEELAGYLGEIDTGYYNILLAHHPDYFQEYIPFGADLILSGHNHGGMICLPFLGGVISPRLHPFPKYDKGLYEAKTGQSKMIVTSGSGMHSVYMRINNPPELVSIKIEKGN